jgi:hypothetical protein|tara:strand:+ start:561 stop:764 length:204 start_codon:yes stop_codon:yes gene_type:complete
LVFGLGGTVGFIFSTSNIVVFHPRPTCTVTALAMAPARADRSNLVRMSQVPYFILHPVVRDFDPLIA